MKSHRRARTLRLHAPDTSVVFIACLRTSHNPGPSHIAHRTLQKVSCTEILPKQQPELQLIGLFRPCFPSAKGKLYCGKFGSPVKSRMATCITLVVIAMQQTYGLLLVFGNRTQIARLQISSNYVNQEIGPLTCDTHVDSLRCIAALRSLKSFPRHLSSLLFEGFTRLNSSSVIQGQTYQIATVVKSFAKVDEVTMHQQISPRTSALPKTAIAGPKLALAVKRRWWQMLSTGHPFRRNWCENDRRV